MHDIPKIVCVCVGGGSSAFIKTNKPIKNIVKKISSFNKCNHFTFKIEAAYLSPAIINHEVIVRKYASRLNAGETAFIPGKLPEDPCSLHFSTVCNCSFYK